MSHTPEADRPRTHPTRSARLDTVLAEAVRPILLSEPADVPAAVASLFGRVGAVMGALRIVWIRVESSDALVGELEWRAAHANSAVGARFDRSEFPDALARLLAGEGVWAARGDDASHSEMRALLEEEHTSAVAVVPARLSDGVPGVVGLAFEGDAFEGEPGFDGATLAALHRLADVAAAALENARARAGRERVAERLHRRQRLESLGVMAGGVAHDFNNMLQVIGAYGQLLRAKLPAGDARDFADEILAAAARAAELTRRLLIFSRDDAQLARILPVGPELARNLGLAARVVRESVTIAADIAPAVEGAHVLCVDFDQAVLNLVNNAAEAGATRVTVTADVAELAPGAELAGGRYARIAVRDDGAGMTEEHLERALEPFYTTKEAGSGTGLGLTMVHGMTMRARGRLSLESRPGKGTTVTLWLPIVEPASAERESDAPPPGGTERVLVIEDDGIVRRVTRAALEDAGYTVLSAADGEEGIRIFERGGPIDVVVTDAIMPRAGGRAVFEALRLRRPDLPFVFCSGYTAGSLGESILGQPGCAFVPKPYAVADLLRAVRRVLDGQADAP